MNKSGCLFTLGMFCIVLSCIVINSLMRNDNISFYSDKSYELMRESIDVKLSGFFFKIDHSISKKHSGDLILSESISGLNLRFFSRINYLVVLNNKKFYELKANSTSGSQGSFGNNLIIPLHVYKFANDNRNVIAYFDIDRGESSFFGSLTKLSALFLGTSGKHVSIGDVTDNN